MHFCHIFIYYTFYLTNISQFAFHFFYSHFFYSLKVVSRFSPACKLICFARHIFLMSSCTSVSSSSVFSSALISISVSSCASDTCESALNFLQRRIISCSVSVICTSANGEAADIVTGKQIGRASCRGRV